MRHIQINADSKIDGREELGAEVETLLERALDRFSDHIIRVEVHLSDQNSHRRRKRYKRCTMVRIRGRKPIAVTHRAMTLHHAVAPSPES
jgi:hypothetical protein